MPRHTAPNHRDCFVDCPAGGFAVYIDPRGPCVARCDSRGLANALLNEIRRDGWGMQSSGVVRGISRRQLGDLARNLRLVPPGQPEVSDLLDDLEQIGTSDGDRVFDASWTGVDAVEVLKALRDAGGDSWGGSSNVTPLTPVSAE